MNNPLRAFVQRFEAKALRKMSNLEEGATVLEIGCGQGVGAKLINKYFSPKIIEGIDLDPDMISRAKRRNKNSSIHFSIGDASNLKFKSGSFDAIFDFAIIHHIPNWKDCLGELKRVLKPGGQIIMEDLSIDTFSTIFGRFLKLFLKHPYDEMYTRNEFMVEIKKLGFKIVKEYRNGYWFMLVLKKTGS